MGGSVSQYMTEQIDEADAVKIKKDKPGGIPELAKGGRL